LRVLRDLLARDRSRDDEPLDLRGALEDRVDLGVAVPALDRVLAVALALDFWTWRRLAREGLDDAPAAAVMTRAIAG
jgi:hypothetical protein